MDGFLESHPGLPEAVAEARRHIAVQFPGSEPVLEIVRDREGGGASDLFIIIPTFVAEARGPDPIGPD